MDANEYACKVTPAAKSLGLLIRKAAWLGKGAAPSEAPGQHVEDVTLPGEVVAVEVAVQTTEPAHAVEPSSSAAEVAVPQASPVTAPEHHMQDHTVTVRVELDGEQAWALAQLLKRIGFSDCRSLAQDDTEARLMIVATERVRQALAQVGIAPR